MQRFLEALVERSIIPDHASGEVRRAERRTKAPFRREDYSDILEESRRIGGLEIGRVV